jgi:hypothetical protein
MPPDAIRTFTVGAWKPAAEAALSGVTTMTFGFVGSERLHPAMAMGATKKRKTVRTTVRG